MFTHNEVTALLWFVVFASGGVIGSLAAWWRLSYRLDECCDCCTCQDCQMREHHDEWASGRFTHRGEDDEPLSDFKNRRTVVLEPGPTIYRALVPLDDESLYGPEKPAKASESTWYRTVVLDWERRYPIPLDSPNGSLR